MDFIICTEDVNRYGYRVLLNGARLDNFKKNPVMLYDHDDWKHKPIGRWENLRVQDGKLIATAVFADGDPQADQVKNLVEKGALNATSVGMMPITYSSDDTYIVPGQTRETVLEWELLEVSIVPVPANPHTVKLKLNNSETESGVLPKQLSFNKPKMNFEKIAKQLGLAADATEDQIVQAVQTLQSENVDLILSLGEHRGVITDANREALRTLAAKDRATTLSLIQNLPQPAGPDDVEEDDDIPQKEQQASKTDEEKPVTLQQILSLVKQNGPAKADADNPDNWDFDTWSKRNPEGLLKMKRQQPEKYEALVQAYQPA